MCEEHLVGKGCEEDWIYVNKLFLLNASGFNSISQTCVSFRD